MSKTGAFQPTAVFAFKKTRNCSNSQSIISPSESTDRTKSPCEKETFYGYWLNHVMCIESVKRKRRGEKSSTLMFSQVTCHLRVLTVRIYSSGQWRRKRRENFSDPFKRQQKTFRLRGGVSQTKPAEEDVDVGGGVWISTPCPVVAQSTSSSSSSELTMSPNAFSFVESNACATLNVESLSCANVTAFGWISSKAFVSISFAETMNVTTQWNEWHNQPLAANVVGAESADRFRQLTDSDNLQIQTTNLWSHLLFSHPHASVTGLVRTQSNLSLFFHIKFEELSLARLLKSDNG